MNRLILTGAVAAATLAGSLPAYAVLAPHYQRAVEIKAILSEQSIIEAFGPYRPIELVKAIGRDRYLLTAGDCRMNVAIKSQPEASPPRVGARQFTVEAGKLECKK